MRRRKTRRGTENSGRDDADAPALGVAVLRALKVVGVAVAAAVDEGLADAGGRVVEVPGMDVIDHQKCDLRS